MSLVCDKYINPEFDKNGVLSKLTFNVPENFNFGYDVVDVLADKKPDQRALIYLSNDKKETVFTFGDIKKYSNMTANYFRSLGIQKGDRVMLVLKRHYQFWFSIIALHKLGAIAIPATHLLTKKDFVYRFQTAGVKAIVCTAEGEVAEHVEASLPECPEMTIKILVNGQRNGWHNFNEEFKDFSSELQRQNTKADELMLMYFTSGTTGYPKIAAHAHTYAIGHIQTAKYWHNVEENGVHFTISDTGWGKAVWGKLYGQWFCECCVFVYDFEKFIAQDILGVMEKYEITTFCAPPTMYRFFIQEDITKYDLSGLKYCTIAGEALNPEVYNKFYEATGLKLCEGFGQTETTLVVATLVGMEPKPGSMGKPSPQYDVALVDGEGNPVANGEVGEICLRTENGAPIGMFKEYYRNEEKTKEAWHDGLYHTGDMAWRDEDGYFWYVGRTDDLIKSSGYRIGPFEIESALMEHPAVVECAVTAVPDPIRGQAVKGTIVLAKGYTPSDALVKEIQDFVKKATAPYKYPRVVEFVDELPKTISGKIKRVDIRNNQ